MTWVHRTWTVVACVCIVMVQGLPPGRAGGHVRHFSTDAVSLAVAALVNSGTGTVLSVGPSTPEFIADYVEQTNRDFIEPTGFCDPDPRGCTPVAVYTPEQLAPLTGLNDLDFDDSVAAGLANLGNCVRGEECVLTPPPYTRTSVELVSERAMVVYGISQSAVIASLLKAELINGPLTEGAVDFVLSANPARPNGGILARFPGAYIPIVGISFTGATPTNSSRADPMLTVDVSRQYDFWTDFPVDPLNLLAVVNAVLGGVYLHHTSVLTDGPPQLQGYYQDTTYSMTPTALLPLVTPLAAVPLIGMPLALALDAPLRVLVETGYLRTVNPGDPTSARILFNNPLKTLADVAVAIPTGWDDAISYITNDPNNRPFRTAPQPMFGVGGPPVYTGAVDPYVVDPQQLAVPTSAELMPSAAITSHPTSAEAPGATEPQRSPDVSPTSDQRDRQRLEPDAFHPRAQRTDGDSVNGVPGERPGRERANSR